MTHPIRGDKASNTFAMAYGELPVARDEEEIAPEISRASEWLDDVGVCESASSSPHWPRKAIHEGTVLSDSVHDITDHLRDRTDSLSSAKCGARCVHAD